MSAKTANGMQNRIVTRVIRHCSSREYFKNGAWTNDPQEADTFSDVVEAAQICARYGLSDVELALRFSSGAHDLFCTSIR